MGQRLGVLKQGATRAALAKLEPRVKKAQTQVDSAFAKVMGCKEASLVKDILSAAKQKLDACEDAVQAAAEAESLLQQCAADAANEHAAELVKAVQAAQACASTAKTTISMKRLVAKRLSESAAQQATSEKLQKMHEAAEAVITKTNEMRMRCRKLVAQ